jgi:hypothetical protein
MVGVHHLTYRKKQKAIKRLTRGARCGRIEKKGEKWKWEKGLKRSGKSCEG